MSDLDFCWWCQDCRTFYPPDSLKNEGTVIRRTTCPRAHSHTVLWTSPVLVENQDLRDKVGGLTAEVKRLKAQNKVLRNATRPPDKSRRSASARSDCSAGES